MNIGGDEYIRIDKTRFESILGILKEAGKIGISEANILREDLIDSYISKKEFPREVILNFDKLTGSNIDLICISRGVKYKARSCQKEDGFSFTDGYSCHIDFTLEPTDQDKRIKADLDYCKCLLEDLLNNYDLISKRRAMNFLEEKNGNIERTD